MTDAPMQYPSWGPLDTPIVSFDFNTFMNSLSNLGLPRSLLTRLHDRGWSFKIDPDRTESFTPDNWFQNLLYGEKTIHLAKSQCFPITGGSALNTISSTSTIFHESTHAYIIEFGDNMQPLLATARLHYKGANCRDRTEGDLDLVLHESGAAYVGDSIEEVLRLILSFKGVANAFNITANRPLIDDVEGEAIKRIAMKDYHDFLSQTVFGVAGGVEITRSIDPQLQRQLDARALEGIRSRAVGMANAQLDR